MPDVAIAASGDGFLITRDGLAAIGAYVDGLHSWIKAAGACLEVK